MYMPQATQGFFYLEEGYFWDFWDFWDAAFCIGYLGGEGRLAGGEVWVMGPENLLGAGLIRS